MDRNSKLIAVAAIVVSAAICLGGLLLALSVASTPACAATPEVKASSRYTPKRPTVRKPAVKPTKKHKTVHIDDDLFEDDDDNEGCDD